MRPTTRSVTTWAVCIGSGLVFGLTMTSGSTSTAAQEVCWTGRHGQFFNAIHYCVSSVLAPQAGNTYGPENLASGNAGAAWCEGASGHGIGESIMIRVEGGSAFRRLSVGNGYGKSSQTYASNGRVKTVELSADTGFTTIVNLADRSDLATVNLPALARDWIRVKIVEVYPGRRFADTCMHFLMPDFEYEEELLLKEQGLLPKQP